MNSSQEIAQTIDEEVEMNAVEEDAEETKSSLGPQVMLGIGLLGFVGFMVNSWHSQLSALKTAPETPAATATVVETKVETEVETKVETEVETEVETGKIPEKFKTSSAAALLSVAPKVPVVAPAPEAAEITPETTIAELNWNLYNQIDGAWRIIPTFNQSLVYRIAVNQNGEVTDYEALNQVAEDHLGETGIDTLKKSDSFIADAEPENSTKFLAVLTPGGGLYVSPSLEK